MQVFSSDHFTVPLPAGHRFPMLKYQRLRERVEAHCGSLVRLREAPAIARAALERVHAADYVARVFAGTLTPAEERRIGLPWSPALLERSRRSVGATCAAARAAAREGIALSLAGGTHHAQRDAGAGFCVFNDIAVAAREARADGRAHDILVLDLDVHQGDGTATILAGHRGVFTFSMHAARNYPHRKASSDCDIGLPDGCTGEAYLATLDLALEHVLRIAPPDLVFYLAGADVYAGDRLGRLALDKAAIAARDLRVFRALEGIGAAVAVVMGGGYTACVDDSVEVHAATVELAAASWSRRQMHGRAAGPGQERVPHSGPSRGRGRASTDF